jgi:hypothetical protein
MSMEGGAAEDENPCCVSDLARMTLGMGMGGGFGLGAYRPGGSSGDLHRKMAPWTMSAGSSDDEGGSDKATTGTPSPPLAAGLPTPASLHAGIPLL